MGEEDIDKIVALQEMTKTLVAEGLLFPMIQPDGKVLWLISFPAGDEHVGNPDEDPTFTWDELLEMYKKQRS